MRTIHIQPEAGVRLVGKAQVQFVVCESHGGFKLVPVCATVFSPLAHGFLESNYGGRYAPEQLLGSPFEVALYVADAMPPHVCYAIEATVRVCWSNSGPRLPMSSNVLLVMMPPELPLGVDATPTGKE